MKGPSRATAPKKFARLSPQGFALKVEPQLERYTPAVRREMEFQRWDPSGLIPPKHAPCKASHTEERSWDGTYHIPDISGVKTIVPLVVHHVMCDLTLQPATSAKFALAAPFRSCLPQSSFSALSNLEMGIVEGDCAVGNISIVEDGLCVLDYEAYIRLPWGPLAGKITQHAKMLP